jgi:D-alanine transaminase
MTIRALPPLPDELRSQGVSAITVEDIRWGRCDIKSVNLLANVLVRQQAKEAGVFEGIFVKDGMVTEGAVSNVMVVGRGALFTAPEGERILSGVTRTLVLNLARREGITVHERYVPRADLDTADEILLTGTTVEVLSVVRLDGKPVGSGRAGPVAERLARQFRLLTR